MKCGLCQQEIEGKVRELNRHKQEAHPEERNAMRQKRKRGVSMNYCPACTKFVSLEAGEPEDQGVDLNEGSVSGSVRMALCCADCSQEMHEAEAEAETDFELEHGEDCPEDEDLECSTGDWTLDESGGGRYSKHLYSATTTVTVSCPECEVKMEVELSTGGVAASYFNSLIS